MPAFSCDQNVAAPTGDSRCQPAVRATDPHPQRASVALRHRRRITFHPARERRASSTICATSCASALSSLSDLGCKASAADGAHLGRQPDVPAPVSRTRTRNEWLRRPWLRPPCAGRGHSVGRREKFRVSTRRGCQEAVARRVQIRRLWESLVGELRRRVALGADGTRRTTAVSSARFATA
jgi:hypothetical protein